MPPQLGWADLRDARVAVWGLGVEGQAALERLRAMGVTPVLVDDRPSGASVDGLPVLATGEGGLDALRRAEVVVKSPGISRYRDDARSLEADGVAVVGGVGLWLQDVDRDRVVLITGTKGKSTTTSIVGHLLRRLGEDCFVGGNLGSPPFALAAGDRHDRWVVEISSYQSTDLAVAPPVVAVTSLHPDHLNWHDGSVEQYYRDKLSVCRLPGARVTVADGTDRELRARRELLGPEVRWVDPPEHPERAWSRALGLRGSHNVRNAELARNVLRELRLAVADDEDALFELAQGFEPLPSRLTPVGSVGGVEFIDDSLSTNVLPTTAAVRSFADRRLALLVGGYDRGIDYDDLAVALRERQLPMIVIGMPDNGPQIVERMRTLGVPERVDTAAAESIEAAVRIGFEWLDDDGVVLLSPAAASFGRYGDYRERAAAFVAAIGECRRDARRG